MSPVLLHRQPLVSDWLGPTRQRFICILAISSSLCFCDLWLGSQRRQNNVNGGKIKPKQGEESKGGNGSACGEVSFVGCEDLRFVSVQQISVVWRDFQKRAAVTHWNENLCSWNCWSKQLRWVQCMYCTCERIIYLRCIQNWLYWHTFSWRFTLLPRSPKRLLEKWWWCLALTKACCFSLRAVF